jgi:hypothetical protein
MRKESACRAMAQVDMTHTAILHVALVMAKDTMRGGNKIATMVYGASVLYGGYYLFNPFIFQ